MGRCLVSLQLDIAWLWGWPVSEEKQEEEEEWMTRETGRRGRKRNFGWDGKNIYICTRKYSGILYTNNYVYKDFSGSIYTKYQIISNCFT